MQQQQQWIPGRADLGKAGRWWGRGRPGPGEEPRVGRPEER